MKAVIEIPFGSRFKYEVDKETGVLVIDRPLPVALPYNYGYIKNTLYKDGDPLDVCVVGDYPIVPLSEVNVVPIGVFICDDNGDSDDKLVAIVEGTNYDESAMEVYLEQVKHYLVTYKAGFSVLGYESAAKAQEIHDWSLENAKNI